MMHFQASHTKRALIFSFISRPFSEKPNLTSLSPMYVGFLSLYSQYDLLTWFSVLYSIQREIPRFLWIQDNNLGFLPVWSWGFQVVEWSWMGQMVLCAGLASQAPVWYISCRCCLWARWEMAITAWILFQTTNKRYRRLDSEPACDISGAGASLRAT